MSGPSQLSFTSSNTSPDSASQTFSDEYSSSPTRIPSSSPSHPSSSFAPGSPLTVIDEEEEENNTDKLAHTKSVVRIIDTKYDLSKNATFEPSRKSSVQEIFNYTEEERRRAENALSPTSLDDFESKVM
jgi:hypothetical protein